MQNFSAFKQALISFVVLCLYALPSLGQTCGAFWQWSHPSPADESIRGIAWNGSRYVAVGENHTTMTSTDGIRWERTPNCNWCNVHAMDVIYANGRFVVLKDWGGFLTSRDGTTWVDINAGSSLGMMRVAFGGGTFVAVGNFGTILTSPDGFSWTQRSSGVSTQLWDVTYGMGRFVVVGYNCPILTSTDGITWNPTSTSFPGDYPVVVACGGPPGAEKFAAVTISGDTALTSPDGINWTAQGTSGLNDHQPGKLIYDGTRFVLAGTDGLVATSPDGVAWAAQASGTDKTLWALCYGAGQYVAAGYQGIVLTSPDAASWTNRQVKLETPTLYGVARNGSRIVAVGTNAYYGFAFASPDGLSWTMSQVTPGVFMNVAYGSGTFAAVGSQGTAWTSPDGISWTPRSTGVSETLWGISFCNGAFWAVGGGGTLLTSPDGVTWSPRSSGTTQQLNAIVHGAGLYVSVGRGGTIITSTDGASWTSRQSGGASANFEAVIHASGRFMAVGEGVATSQDGIAWTYQMNMFARGVAYLDGLWVAVETAGRTQTSLDGSNWTNMCNSDSVGFYGLIATEDHFVAVGSRGRVMTSYPLPIISSVAPDGGPDSGGTGVTITGTHLSGATSVHFGDSEATAFTPTSDTSLSVVTPPGITGECFVGVGRPTGRSVASLPAKFTYYGTPAVSSLSPSSGPTTGGGLITIWGQSFTGVTAVHFGSASANFTFRSSTEITASPPAQSEGTVYVTVTTPDGTSGETEGAKYTYYPLPSVESLTPNKGPVAGGTPVTISGTGFSGTTVVKFGSLPAQTFALISDTKVTATSPPQAAGAVYVTVSNEHGTSGAWDASHFTYLDPPQATGLSPSTGPTAGGTTVVITGSGLSAVTAVRFGEANAASFVPNSDSQVTASTPPHEAGTVDVTITTPGGTTAAGSAMRFTYVAPAPVITGVSPTSGSPGGGTEVTITGTGFTGASAVKFGTVPALSYTVASDTSIAATSPPQAAGTVCIAVTTAGGTSGASEACKFTYSLVMPTVASLAPQSGPTSGGTSVSIGGSGFSGATSVRFGDVNASSFSVSSDSLIQAVSPAHGAGNVDVQVTAPGGTSPAGEASKFTFVADYPVVAGISPSAGGAAGGTEVAITGSGFAGASEVRFGSVPATSFSVLSADRISAISPPHSPGTVCVSVTARGVSSTEGPDCGFTYTSGQPTLLSLTPARGTSAGGSITVLKGTGFVQGAAVFFGGVAAVSVIVEDSTTATVYTPRHQAGTVDISLVNPDGTAATLSGGYTFLDPPTVTAIHTATTPFKLKLEGTNFHTQCTVRIDGIGVPSTAWKNAQLTVAKGGKDLKAMVPRDVTVHITITNEDDGLESAPVYYSRH